MCAVCGCGEDHGHDHHHHHHGHEHRVIRVEEDLLAENDRVAARNRALWSARRALSLNLMSSPGAGKTTLLVRTLADLRGRFPVAVIEGDQQTTLDADRIRAAGAPAVQVTTGKACHLDAAMVERAIADLPAEERAVIFIENVGNLVCPAGFDLGESRRVVIASVTEGEDKPLKYAGMFAAADLVLVSKIDLLPHLDFDLDLLIANARRARPGVEVITVSARSGAGLSAWYAWLEGGRT
jgi:hydrogenase nickel incorporation protein HypB